jgi:lipoate-protein ligase A
VWSGTTVLQHGSFVRSRDVALETRLFRLDAAAQARLEADTVTLHGALGGQAPSIQRIRESVMGGFSAALGIILEPGHWTPLEASIAQELMCEPDQKPESPEAVLQVEVSPPCHGLALQ